MTDHLQELTEAGVSIWLDDLSREDISRILGRAGSFAEVS